MPPLQRRVTQTSTTSYTASERLYVTADGRVLREDELNENTPASLLAAEGGAISAEDATRYGLDKDAVDVPAEQPNGEGKARVPVANKMRTSAPEDKGA